MAFDSTITEYDMDANSQQFVQGLRGDAGDFEPDLAVIRDALHGPSLLDLHILKHGAFRPPGAFQVNDLFSKKTIHTNLNFTSGG